MIEFENFEALKRFVMKVENDAFESLDLIKFEDFEMFVFCIIEFENDVIVEFVSIER